MKAYKGLNKDLTCRGLQYSVGKKTVHEGSVELCDSGLHACANALDVLRYYAPATGARYFEVECNGDIQTHNEDSKLACSEITLQAEIGLFGIIKAGMKAIFRKVKGADQYASGDWSTAATSGDWSTAATSGDWSTAATSGYKSTAATSGDWSTAATSGDESTAATSGDWSTAATSGYKSTAATSGDWSTAAVNGKDSIAVANGTKATAQGALGCYLVLTEYQDGHILHCKCRKVDGRHIKPNTLYKLVNGKFEEAT